VSIDVINSECLFNAPEEIFRTGESKTKAEGLHRPHCVCPLDFLRVLILQWVRQWRSGDSAWGRRARNALAGNLRNRFGVLHGSANAL